MYQSLWQHWNKCICICIKIVQLCTEKLHVFRKGMYKWHCVLKHVWSNLCGKWTVNGSVVSRNNPLKALWNWPLGMNSSQIPFFDAHQAVQHIDMVKPFIKVSGIRAKFLAATYCQRGIGTSNSRKFCAYLKSITLVLEEFRLLRMRILRD
jgi:hypothetical protein